MANYLQAPLGFEPLRSGARERFVARGPRYIIGLQEGKAILSAGGATARPPMSMEFRGGHPGAAVIGDELPGKVNYIHGNDPGKWQIGKKTFGRVTYPHVYPGVDVVYYGNQKQLEFDLVLKPGANPDAIRMKVAGASGLAIDKSGAVALGGGEFKIDLPKIYQDLNGKRTAVSGHYALRGKDEIAFAVDRYDRSRALIIDPTIVYSALLGGTGTSVANAVAVDGSGNVYVAGYASTTDFPVVNAFQSGLSVANDGMIAKLNASGTALLYSTYFGGAGTDLMQSIAVDSSGNAWVAGYSSSPDFPLVNPTQATFGGGGADAVVVELGPTGAPIFSTYLGGSGTDEALGIAVDSTETLTLLGLLQVVFPPLPEHSNRPIRA